MGLPESILFQGGGGGGMVMGGNSAGAAGAAAAVEAPKVKEVFDIKLKAVSQAAKIKVIKEVRTITGLGLKEVNSPALVFID